jgi:hypothetical protein
MSPEIRQLFAMVCYQVSCGRQASSNEPTVAKFHGPSSPQLHIEYRIGRPVALSALLMLLYRSNEICGVPARPSL